MVKARVTLAGDLGGLHARSAGHVVPSTGGVDASIVFDGGGTRCRVDSIASGRGLEVDEDGRVGWRIIRPDIERLRHEFVSGRRLAELSASTS